jgi:succinate-semialdehyde dehydrogenase / glutarate-semialdehyde dehydrogenase
MANRHATENPMKLKDSALLRMQAYVNGQWINAAGGASHDVTNPATNEKLGTVPDMGVADTRRAIEAASAAFPAWAARTAKDRAVILRRWFDLMMANQDDLAYIMTAEQGKPLAEAKGEVAYAASFIEWFAEESKRLYGDVIPPHQTDKRLLALRQPIGVVAAITPWNFPAAMITRKAGPALAAGCTIVCKPAQQTPYSALAMAELAARAGLPPGVLNVVTGRNAAEIGGEMTSNPVVRKITFTGSTAVGKKLMAQSSGTLKKLSLELGGNAPFIVFEDADLDAAVAGAIASKYRNTGQTCVCANRLLVQSRVYEPFANKLVDAVAQLRVGDGLKGPTEQGPLIDAKALEKVEQHVADALAKGGKIVHGGKRHALGGTFFQPTIITNVTADMLVAREETFGPVAPLISTLATWRAHGASRKRSSTASWDSTPG